MLVGPVPERLHRRHPELPRAAHVLVEAVADEHCTLGLDVERLERPLEDGRVRLARPDLGREDAEVEPLREAHLLEVAVQQPAGSKAFETRPSLSPRSRSASSSGWVW